MTTRLGSSLPQEIQGPSSLMAMVISGGLLTGSSGKYQSSNVTYTTPIWWLQCIKANGFSIAHIYPTMG
jgi:hypothetical protein